MPAHVQVSACEQVPVVPGRFPRVESVRIFRKVFHGHRQPHPPEQVLRSAPGNVHFARSPHGTVGLVVAGTPLRCSEPTRRSS